MINFRKKRDLSIYLLIIIVVSSLMGCSKETSKYIKEEPLTMEEKLEDFEWLYNFIAENYPFLKVNERVNGIHWLGEKDKFRTAIENAGTDNMFIDEIIKIIEQLNNSHTQVLGGMSFPYFYSFYSNPECENMFKPRSDVLKDEKSFKVI